MQDGVMQYPGPPSNGLLTGVPDFARLGSPLPPAIDRKLGYHGNSVLVMFYSKPGLNEVVCFDGLAYSFGTGGCAAFATSVLPLARRYHVDVGGAGRPATHVLLLDRIRRNGFLLGRRECERLLRRCCGGFGAGRWNEVKTDCGGALRAEIAAST